MVLKAYKIQAEYVDYLVGLGHSLTGDHQPSPIS